ncbi:hypothetical protein AAG570_002751 [Ranatra chinensis]|uniref:Uncharacterized protein n=1 Tax=Ranatra chinensis TaxID=642074 RepID=A0ABD0Y4U3_9HEMI
MRSSIGYEVKDGRYPTTQKYPIGPQYALRFASGLDIRSRIFRFQMKDELPALRGRERRRDGVRPRAGHRLMGHCVVTSSLPGANTQKYVTHSMPPLAGHLFRSTADPVQASHYQRHTYQRLLSGAEGFTFEKCLSLPRFSRYH